MKRFLQGMVALGMFSCLALLAQAQVAVLPSPPEEVQQIDTAEIARRIAMGLNVQSTGGVQATDADAIGAVAAPPQDDTHKWFVSVVCNGNAESERLKRDWKASTTGNGNDLKNIAVPGNTKASWAHFNVYEMTDTYQAWREKRWAIKKFPAVIVQAPASGKYGPEGEIVCQFEGYEGDPAKLYKQLSSWIAKRALKYHHVSYGLGKKDATKEGHEAAAGITHEDGQCPLPYAPTPQPYQPTGPVWVQPELPPQAPPAPASTTPPSSQFNWTTIVLAILAFLGISGTGIAMIIGVVLTAMSMWRTSRKVTGKPTVLDDAQYSELRKDLTDLMNKAKGVT